MKLYKLLAIAFAGSLFATSCNDWFDVTSSNEIREKDHYSKDSGFKQSLIGCYLKMGEEDLFGKDLSWYMPDLLANETRKFVAYSSNTASFELQKPIIIVLLILRISQNPYGHQLTVLS